jgi:glycosyltransferase involved in cell wall biosynthesis
VYDLILAFYELLELNKGFHLHIAGGMDPAYEDYFHALHNLVADLGIQEKVTFYGNVQDPWNWYHNIDIFVSNSYSEGLQVAPMEAMASGCFCLAHRWRGADELLPEDYLYHTAAELVEKISRYSMMTDLDKNGQKRYMRTIAEEKFDIKQTVNQVVQLIDDIAIND